MEQSALHDNTDLNFVVSTVPSWMNCPSRRPAKAYTAGPVDWQPYWTTSLTKVARNDYAMSSGTMTIDDGGPSNKNGPPPTELRTDGLAGRGWLAQLSDVIDGTSNTYLIGEKYVNPDHYQTGLDLGDNENAYTGSDRDTLRINNQPMRDRNGADYSYSFGSAHGSVFYMSYCDGSIHAARYEIDPTTHKYLCQRNDRQVVRQAGL